MPSAVFRFEYREIVPSADFRFEFREIACIYIYIYISEVSMVVIAESLTLLIAAYAAVA